MINSIPKSIFIYFLFFATIVCAQTKAPAYPVDSSYTVSNQLRKYQKHYPYLIPAKDQDFKGVVGESDVIYTSLKNTKYGKRDLHLDIFRPEKEGKFPAIILVHGGGWRAGNKQLLVPMAQMIAKQGFVAVSVEYQLGLEAPYPAAVHNIKSAIRWMRANAEKYNIDADKIVISGTSAGGHLASLVGLTNGLEKFEGTMGNSDSSSEIQAIIDIDGVLNFMAPISLNKERADDSPDVQWIGGQFKDVPELWKEVSPIYWANENSVPMLFINSGYPRFHAGQDELIGMFNEWGIYNDVVKFKVRMHTFWLFHPFIDETVDYMVDFMNKVL
ncbi:alpha/beta hydrolase [Plebeiibacterium sediminum]|uniref:Alpha/beta hydrolase n=1 Tax=Plebeiibacterium sediminum TaxID=2992112 RepID=A0AAE3M1W7_9BACT|nr:alpha/beta hydrolase [Plebeiobacterium sediminum]MCW3785584.1 alpha/beta hydrolase [Plebeiobacterium sediminum]